MVNGYCGSLELGWFKNPPKEVYEELVEKHAVIGSHE
jgi:hypothetical protein